jgi:hypothetical protein
MESIGVRPVESLTISTICYSHRDGHLSLALMDDQAKAGGPMAA